MYQYLDSAIAFAATAHAGQIRKHTGLPYVLHPIAVMQLVHDHAADPSEPQLIAALLHDVVEDTTVSLDTITRRFGVETARLVWELTDQYADPALGNRATRKSMERERQANISPAAQTIKYADLIHNTESIARFDPGFARVYLKEKEALLSVMRMGDPILLSLAEASLTAGQAQLVQHALEKADEHTHPRNTAAPAPATDDPADAGPAPGLAGIASIAR
jgi:hypothetical protein